MLGRTWRPKIVFADAIDATTRRKFASPTRRFETGRLDLAAVGRECEAIHNANHGTLARLLLAGRPMVQLPLTLEQTVLARAVDRTGAAETVLQSSADVGGELARKLDAVLRCDRYAALARAFAERYRDFDPAAQVRRMVERVEELLEENSRRRAAGRDCMPVRRLPAGNVPAGVFRA